MLGLLLPEVPELVRSIERHFGLRDRIVLAAAILGYADAPEDWVLKPSWWTLSPGRRRLVVSFTDDGPARRELACATLARATSGHAARLPLLCSADAAGAGSARGLRLVLVGR